VPPLLVLFLTWLLAVVLASAVGFFAIGLVGAVLRDRGPLGVVPEQVSGNWPVEPGNVVIADRFGYGAGELTVECLGAAATLVDVRPATGWLVIDAEAGPDEDVDVSFRRGPEAGAEQFDVEVYCNEGRPRAVLDG
jgi:hypothetical protein